MVIYPLVNIQKAIENGPVEIVDFPMNSMVIFYSDVKLPEGNIFKGGKVKSYKNVWWITFRYSEVGFYLPPIESLSMIRPFDKHRGARLVYHFTSLAY